MTDDVVSCTLTFTHFLARFVPYLRPSLVNYSDLKLNKRSKRGRARACERIAAHRFVRSYWEGYTRLLFVNAATITFFLQRETVRRFVKK